MKNQTKTKRIIGGYDDQVERAKSLPQSISDSLFDDLLKKTPDSLWKQVVGGENRHDASGDLKEGEEIDLKGHKKEEPQHVEPAYNYAERVLDGEKRIHAEDSREIQVKIEEIMIELKKVVESSKELQVEFRQVAVEQAPSKPGKYHLNFVEWLLENVRQIRLRIEDSGAWLAAFKSKKDKKQYWNMFKKHGTSFALTNERNVATQVG